MSGGEPFLYPGFVKLCSDLTRRHYISINTNLSTSNVYDFVNLIFPKKVIIINAAFHVVEREKRNEGKSDFIDKVRCLRNRGFDVRVEYVVYPPLFSRLAKDVEYLESQGIEVISLKIFRGLYFGREYPQSYTEPERTLINRYTCDVDEEVILENEVSFWGRPCSAGQKFFSMDVEGNITRCTTSLKGHGNLFEGEYYFDKTPKPCPFLKCGCPYEGIKHVKKGKSSKLSTFREIRQELLFRRESKHYQDFNKAHTSMMPILKKESKPEN